MGGGAGGKLGDPGEGDGEMGQGETIGDLRERESLPGEARKLRQKLTGSLCGRLRALVPVVSRCSAGASLADIEL